MRMRYVIVVVCLLLAFAVVQGEGKTISSGTAKTHFQMHTNTTTLWFDTPPTTTFLAFYAFDTGPSCDGDGWVSVDITAQIGDFFHVDDFAGLGGGSSGMLVPLQGAQSLWCGARPSVSPPLCGYLSLPGYGNNWDQAFCTKSCLAVNTGVSIDFTAAWDTEYGYDGVTIEIDNCDDNWLGLVCLEGRGSGAQSVSVPDSLNNGSIRARIHFESDASWSDEDAMYDTDGAIVIDELSVNDSGGSVLAVENFEAASPGATSVTDWQSCTPAGYGDFASLYPGVVVLQEDPFRADFTCQWAFFNGSTNNYGCGGYPAQTVVPYVNARGQYIANEIWSPMIPLVGNWDTVEMSFDVYRDLTLDATVFYTWKVRSVVAGCPTPWKDDGFVYYGPDKDWFRHIQSLGTLVDYAATDLQVSLGVVDMCAAWCGVYGSGSCHSHAPLFDNVAVYSLDTYGPTVEFKDITTFHDTFADASDIGRMDIAADIGSSPDPLPGDSMTVRISDRVGLAVDGGGRPEVYLYVNVKRTLAVGVIQEGLTSDPVRWPYVGSVLVDTTLFHCIQGDTSYDKRGRPIKDEYCWDLNDSLFRSGDIVSWLIQATNQNGEETVVTLKDETKSIALVPFEIATGVVEAVGEGGVTLIKAVGSTVGGLINALGGLFGGNSSQQIEKGVKALGKAKVLKVLGVPKTGSAVPGRILYVNSSEPESSAPYFYDAFDHLGVSDLVDEYRVRGPSSIVSNGPASRVLDVGKLRDTYRCIIWDAGDIEYGTIGDGTGGRSKSDDFQLLYDYLDQNPNEAGIFICGNNVAEEWVTLSGAGAINMRSYIQFSLVSADHTTQGLRVSPLVIGEPGSIFDAVSGPDSLVAYGGLHRLKDFDVLAPAGAATVQMSYEGNASLGAVLAQSTLNGLGVTQKVVLSGFADSEVREPAETPKPLLQGVTYLQNILAYFAVPTNTPVGVETPTIAASLGQNYPNPCNPTSTIKYTIAAPGMVTLRVYNVAGQLVRTLVREPETVGVHEAVWNGRNDYGAEVASGVYFYRLASPGFTATRKMVLLK